MPDRTSQWNARFPFWGGGALLFGLVLVCYWPALSGELLWDDPAHVTREELRPGSGLARIWLEPGATQQYYPVLHSVFWLEYRLWGDATIGYHLANVAWHTLAACLLVPILRRLWAERSWPTGADWLAAAIFAVHPVCVESVAWISEQKNTLSLVLYLAAALAWLHFEAERRWRFYFIAAGFFLLALGTKTVTATLPAALLVMQWWRRGSIEWRRDVVPLLPWFLASVVAGLFTAWVERTVIGAAGAAFDLSLGERALLAGRIVWFYFGKLLWPVDLMFVYPRWEVGQAAGWYAGLVGVVAVTVTLWWFRRRGRGALAGWLFFVGSLFPALGFFNVYPFLFSYVADHFQYLASLGVIVTVAAGVALGLERAPAPLRTGGWILCATLVGVLGWLTHRQSGLYVDSVTLYQATLARNPACWMAHNNLAVILAKNPATEAEALAHYHAALRLKPDYAEAHNNFAVELLKRPDGAAEAAAHCEAALGVRPDYAEAHCNLANALMRLSGREAEAMLHYEQGLRLDPGNAEIHYSLANALAPQDLTAAIVQYETALQFKPDYTQARVNLANTLAKIPERRAEALTLYEQVLRADPTLAEVHYNFAVQLAATPGRVAEAAQHYEEAIRLQPNYAKAHNNLAALYAQQGRFDDAQKHWERALQLNPDYEEARKNLERLRRLRQP